MGYICKDFLITTEKLRDRFADFEPDNLLRRRQKAEFKKKKMPPPKSMALSTGSR